LQPYATSATPTLVRVELRAPSEKARRTVLTVAVWVVAAILLGGIGWGIYAAVDLGNCLDAPVENVESEC
jgi:hypothetical protein